MAGGSGPSPTEDDSCSGSKSRAGTGAERGGTNGGRWRLNISRPIALARWQWHPARALATRAVAPKKSGRANATSRKNQHVPFASPPFDSPKTRMSPFDRGHFTVLPPCSSAAVSFLWQCAHSKLSMAALRALGPKNLESLLR
jgi:hypothetical protein